MKDSCDLFIFAGEPSADLHGSLILKALKEKAPRLNIQGVFGPKMREECPNVFIPTEEFHVMGFSDVLKALPKLRRNFKKILNYLLTIQPKTILLIDYPGFNLRLAKALRKGGYTGKIIHYICPSVWAWKQKRIHSMEKTLDLLLCIFPFEPKYFETSSLKTLYVGNPSLEIISQYTYTANWKDFFAIPKENTIISLFPGSREGEIIRNLPHQLESAKLLQKEFPNTTICISSSSEKSKKTILNILIKHDISCILVPEPYNFDLMKASKVAIAKCGTVTLELALHATPTVVTYQLSCLNAFLAKYIFRIRLPFYCIANILLQKKIFPELIYKEFTPENTYKLAKELFRNTQTRQECLKDCQQLIHCLATQKTPSKLIAEVI